MNRKLQACAVFPCLTVAALMTVIAAGLYGFGRGVYFVFAVAIANAREPRNRHTRATPGNIIDRFTNLFHTISDATSGWIQELWYWISLPTSAEEEGDPNPSEMVVSKME